jgi:uncharacterized protein YkwD
MNARRAQGATCGVTMYPPAPPLTMDPRLTAAARGHSADMARRGYFDHDTPEGRTMVDRIRAAGYRGGRMGENIAAGKGTAAETVQQWMDSPGHCENIMDRRYTAVGVGYAFQGGSRLGHYWTQDFGG